MRTILQKIIEVGQKGKSVHTMLPEMCNCIAIFPDVLGVLISYKDINYYSSLFTISKNVQIQELRIGDKVVGGISIYYKEQPEYKMFDEADLFYAATLITGFISENQLVTVSEQCDKRTKELDAIKKVKDIINSGAPTEKILQDICDILPLYWKYSDCACCRIKFDTNTYTSHGFQESTCSMKETFVTFDNTTGTIEIFYTKDDYIDTENLFLPEEHELANTIGYLLCRHINDTKGRLLSNNPIQNNNPTSKEELSRESLINSDKPLQKLLNEQTLDKYIYLDMMKHKVSQILFVATMYDAFNLEKDDSFFEKFMGPIYQYSIFSLPRIIGVSSHKQALDLLKTTHFDLVVLMVGADVQKPLSLSAKIKKITPEVPVYLLLNPRSNIAYFEDMVAKTTLFNKIFIWSGDSQIFFAMVKSLEDLANVENDTKIGLVRTMLLIEDSTQYYSKYLPIIFSVLFDQVGEQISDFESNELEKLSKIRSRPKLLWARNYEEATFLFNKYKDFMTCVISDMEFERNGVLDKNAGMTFMEHVREYNKNMPILIQSSELKYSQYAKEIHAKFVNKKSDMLLDKIKKFVMHNFGYGDFIFRNGKGEPIAKAKNLREFEMLLRTIPDDSLKYHADQNQFSIWLMGRGEIELARQLNPVNLADLNNDVSKLREMNNIILDEYRLTKKRGKILSFEETAVLDEKNVVTLAAGSLGGKGRGLAFVNTLINSIDINPYADQMAIRTPKTAVIGTEEFELFIKHNFAGKNLFSKDLTDEQIKEMFIAGRLSEDLRRKLAILLEQISKPLAVRSSSIFEDSVTQPLAGVFSTYIIPNNNKDLHKRLSDLEIAIKLVYASVYSEQVKEFYKSTSHKLEEEKMAIVIQEVVGDYYDQYFYPHICGVAQSYNYYPIAHMKPEEGFAVCAVGLGFYIVDGGNAYRFSPRYPKVEIMTPKDQIKSSQTHFYAVDFTKDEYNYKRDGEHAALTLLSISEAEKHNTLRHCASTYNYENDRIEPGLSSYGPRIINFADILKYDYAPLSEILTLILNTVQEAMGTPVEIEFAVDLNENEDGVPSFYLLQIKPLTGSLLTENAFPEVLKNAPQLLRTTTSMGNGFIENISDAVYIDLEKFDKLRTLEMVAEIEKINKAMVEKGRKYLLIGPGRWGTSDRFLGIPVLWSQISNAKVIVEISLSNFPLDASLGSHFFHNISTMNIGYFAIEHTNEDNFINWDILKQQKVVEQTEFFIHVQFEKNLCVYMQGKERTATIFVNESL
ncbi:MAG: pyruvate, phosphate dikinase [Bacteroidales bacterium]|nr:pyruvate, phosphate dikinase [Bacteroidales bacterium]